MNTEGRGREDNIIYILNYIWGCGLHSCGTGEFRLVGSSEHNNLTLGYVCHGVSRSDKRLLEFK